MQTFILNHDLFISAQQLDSKRLNKQLTECHQIINIIVLKQKAWSNHPCVLQWKNNMEYLYNYTYTIAYECKQRLINHKHIPYYLSLGFYRLGEPQWITDEFIKRHRQALLFKTALKYAVYDYCYNHSLQITPHYVNTGLLSLSFYRYLGDNYDKFNLYSSNVLTHYQRNKPFFQGNQKVTQKMLSNAEIEYQNYVNYFDKLPHVLDYLWGVI